MSRPKTRFVVLNQLIIKSAFKEGHTPLLVAVLTNNSVISEFLLTSGADPLIKDKVTFSFLIVSKSEN